MDSLEKRLNQYIAEFYMSGETREVPLSFLKEVRDKLASQQLEINRMHEAASAALRESLETIPYDRLAD